MKRGRGKYKFNIFCTPRKAPIHSSIASEEYGEGEGGLHTSTDETLGAFSLMSTHVQQNELIAFLMYNTIILYKKSLTATGFISLC